LNSDLKPDPRAHAQQAVEFGAAMRDMRLAHKRELADVANSLRIRHVYLKAIEEGRFDDLPGPTYAVGFVRAYADYLGLEIDEVMRRYRDATGDQPAQGPLVPPTPVVEARLPTGFILLVAIVLAVAAYGGWYYLTIHGKDTGEVISQIPAQIAEMVGLTTPEDEKPDPVDRPSAPLMSKAAGDGAEKTRETGKQMAASVNGNGEYRPPANGDQVTGETAADTAPTTGEPPATDVAASAPPPAVPEKAPVVEVTPAPAPVSVETPVEVTPAPAPVETVTAPATPVEPSPAPVEAPPPPVVVKVPEPVMTPPVEAPVPTAPVAETVARQIATAPIADAVADSRVVLRANEMSWVELRDGAGKRLISRLLEAGETYNVPARPGIMMVTGNAGGVDILVDGKAILPIGPTGAVRRDILLEAEALLAR
jgi:cytoskeletal protein RodZ